MMIEGGFSLSESTLAALICFAIFSLAGWIMLVSALQSRRKRLYREERERARATGKIVEYIHRTKRIYRGPTIRQTLPVIEFTADGRLIRQEYENSLKEADYPVGAAVDVLYDADDPARFHLEADESFAKEAGSLLRIGVVMIVASAVLAFGLAMLLNRPPADFPRPRSRARRVETASKDARTSDFQYALNANGTAVIQRYTGSASSLTIPMLLDGHLVTEIGMMAFVRAEGLRELTVPGIVGAIPMGAFSGCMALKTVTVEEGVASIGKLAFGYCRALGEVRLPASVNSIADDAFPEDCRARFYVVEGSRAQEYCDEKGFDIEIVEG